MDPLQRAVMSGAGEREEGRGKKKTEKRGEDEGRRGKKEEEERREKTEERRPAGDTIEMIMDLSPSEKTESREKVPLAERMRPRRLDEFIGQDHLLGPGKFLRRMLEGGRIFSILLWGPPGSGKTTLARMIARHAQTHFVQFSAVLSGVKDLRESGQGGRRTVAGPKVGKRFYSWTKSTVSTRPSRTPFCRTWSGG